MSSQAIFGASGRTASFAHKRIRAISGPNVGPRPSAPWVPPPPPQRLDLPKGALVSKHVGWLRLEPFLKDLPARVRKGQCVATVSALGTAHNVVAPYDGLVTELLSQCGEPAEYGHPIMCIMPT
jgi:biotin carboxyl carrier protein